MRKLSGSRALERIFVIPDLHAPYHDPVALATAVKALRAFDPHKVVILGDFFDFYSISFYAKDPRRKSLLADELVEAAEAADTVDRVTRNADVFFCRGNHEHRYERYVRDRAPAIEGMTKPISDYLPASWTLKPYGTTLKLGKMHYSHDFGRSGDQATRQGLVDVGRNICFGHTHQLKIDTLGQLDGDRHVAVNCGWLGGLQFIDYKHAALAKRRYQHGFATVHQDKQGNVWPSVVSIIGGRCMINGKVVSV